MNLLTISGSPHIHGEQYVKKIMWGVVLALLPAMFVSFWYFGTDAILVTLTAIISCVAFEFLIQKLFFKNQNVTVTDGSAVITGILLAFNVPANLPLWEMVIGSFVAIAIAKMSYGGLGKNPFNPALVGRVFLLISFPADMTTWPVPKPFATIVDAITGPTALGVVKEGLMKGETISQITQKSDSLRNIINSGQTVSDLQNFIPQYYDMFLGSMGGSLGEVSAIALILGALYLLFRKIISWHIPVSFIGTVLLFTFILWQINPEQYINPLFHLLTGGLLLGACFMATDMVTSPMTHQGMIVFGIGCGLLTTIIRIWGAYPEGVSFAILIMNAIVPLINRAFKPKVFGKGIKNV